MTIPLGDVIWASVKPIIKIYLIIGTGFLLSKMDIITAESTKSISDIVLTVLLPCLSFNKIVSNIESNDIKNVGIICLSAVLIFATGLFFAYVVSKTMPVPKEWKGGILAGGMFPNISDLPIAYLQTLDQGFIFTPEEGEKGVASVIIFLAMFLICLFNLGGFRLIESDFSYNDEENVVTDSESIQQASESELQDIPGEKSSNIKNDELQPVEDDLGSIDSYVTSIPTANSSRLTRVLPQPIPEENIVENFDTLNPVKTTKPSVSVAVYPEDDDLLSTRTSILSRDTSMAIPFRTESQPVAYTTEYESMSRPLRRPRTSSAHSMHSHHSMNALIRSYSHVDQFGRLTIRRDTDAYSIQESVESYSSFQRMRNSDLTRMLTSDASVSKHDIEMSGTSFPRLIRKFPLTPYIVFFLKNCLRPCSVAVILALTCAFIPWVKALFVTTSHTPTIRQAPDQQPPLSFIIDFTGYVGAASVPFGLLLLGSTLGRLSIGTLYPGFWKSASVLVLLRQCIMPIFGVLWCDRLVKAGWVNWEDDKLLLFVIAISWALPTMTTLIYFTASYTPADIIEPIQMECVSFFLMIQYPLLVVSLPFLVTCFLKVQMNI